MPDSENALVEHALSCAPCRRLMDQAEHLLDVVAQHAGVTLSD